MRQQGKSSALIFVDVKSAFYSIMREFALQHFMEVCTRLGLSGDQKAAIQATLAMPPHCSVAQVPEQARLHLADLLKCTCFQVPGCSQVVSTCSGSRPS